MENKNKNKGKIEKIRLELEYKVVEIFKVELVDFPKNTYILSSKISKEILYNPHIAGKKLQDKLELMSELFINVGKEIAFKGEKISNIVEFILLSGALYYNLNYGFKKEFGFALPQCFLGIKRQKVEGTEGQFRAISTYENFESLVDDVVILMGDTIASGSTIVRAINDLKNVIEEKNYKIKKIIIYSIACSTEGAKRIKQLEDKIGIDIYLIVCEQFFHMMPNGTDLRFLGENAIMPDSTKRYTIEKYGEKLGRNMKCAVFDWGTRCKNPIRHYNEFLSFSNEILSEKSDNKLDEKGKKEIYRMKRETENELKRLNEFIV